jgi:predicted transcriptional regulator
MTTTTIKVDSAVRDRLALVARARGVTMTVLLQQMSLQLQAEQNWADIEAAYGRLQREDPEGWEEYLSELRAWDTVPADPGDAATEWPEFNS